MQRARILIDAKECVCKDRNNVHGEPENNFDLIAKLWSAYLGAPLTAKDVGLMMVLFKAARAKNANGDAYVYDNYVDMAGYAACAGECDLNAYAERYRKEHGCEPEEQKEHDELFS